MRDRAGGTNLVYPSVSQGVPNAPLRLGRDAGRVCGSPRFRAKAAARSRFAAITLIDGTGGAPIADATVVIEATGSRKRAAALQAPAGARTIDGRGKFLIPGLIDAHIHLRGGRGSSGSAADQEREGVRALHSYLYSGVTTVFDAGNRPEYIMGLRSKERAGTIVSPRIFATGGTVASPNGHGGPYNVEAWPGDRHLLDEHLATQPDMAKIGQDEHGWGTRPQINQLPDDLLREDHPATTTRRACASLFTFRTSTTPSKRSTPAPTRSRIRSSRRR